MKNLIFVLGFLLSANVHAACEKPSGGCATLASHTATDGSNNDPASQPCGSSGSNSTGPWTADSTYPGCETRLLTQQGTCYVFGSACQTCSDGNPGSCNSRSCDVNEDVEARDNTSCVPSTPTPTPAPLPCGTPVPAGFCDNFASSNFSTFAPGTDILGPGTATSCSGCNGCGNYTENLMQFYGTQPLVGSGCECEITSCTFHAGTNGSVSIVNPFGAGNQSGGLGYSSGIVLGTASTCKGPLVCRPKAACASATPAPTPTPAPPPPTPTPSTPTPTPAPGCVPTGSLTGVGAFGDDCSGGCATNASRTPVGALSCKCNNGYFESGSNCISWVCTPNAVGTDHVSCNNHGVKTQTCAADGSSWGAWSGCVCDPGYIPMAGTCYACAPGSTQNDTVACNGHGVRTKTCAADGSSWGAFQACVCSAGWSGSDCNTKNTSCPANQYFSKTSGSCVCTPPYENTGTAAAPVCKIIDSHHYCDNGAGGGPASPVSSEVKGGSDTARFDSVVNKKLACCMNTLASGTTFSKFDCIDNSSQASNFDTLWTSSSSSSDETDNQMNALLLTNANGKPLTGFYTQDGARCDDKSEFAGGSSTLNKVQVDPAIKSDQQNVATNATGGVQTLGTLPWLNTSYSTRIANGKTVPSSANDYRRCPLLVRAAIVTSCPKNPAMPLVQTTYTDSNGKVRCTAASTIKVHIRAEQVFTISGQTPMIPVDTVVDYGKSGSIAIEPMLLKKNGSKCEPGAAPGGSNTCQYQ